MRQQVNLFQSVLVDKPKPLQVRQFGLLVLAWAAVLLLFGLLGQQRLNTSISDLAELQQQHEIVQARVTTLEANIASRRPDPRLAERAHSFEQKLISLKELLNYLSRLGEADNDLFIEVLDGLARHRMEGLWLRQLKLGRRGQDVQLAGSAVRPDLVPRYLQSLASKDVLGGQIFSSLEMTLLEQGAGVVEFSLESKPGEQR